MMPNFAGVRWSHKKVTNSCQVSHHVAHGITGKCDTCVPGKHQVPSKLPCKRTAYGILRKAGLTLELTVAGYARRLLLDMHPPTRQYHQIAILPFFRQYRQWKSFAEWKSFSRMRKWAKCRAVLEEDLFTLHPWLRIGELKRKSEENPDSS